MRSSWGWASILAITVAWPAMGLAQSVGNCVTITGACDGPDQCGDGAMCAPEGSCIKIGEQCTEADSKKCGTDPCIAQYGTCKSDPDCKEGGFCSKAGNCLVFLGEPPPPPPGDGGVGGFPIPCEGDGDCGPGVCSPEGFCAPPMIACSSDQDCGPGKCDTKAGFCIPPEGPDCMGDPACEQGGPMPECPPGAPCEAPVAEGSGRDDGSTDAPEQDATKSPTGDGTGEPGQGSDEEAQKAAEEKAAPASICSVQRVGAGQAGLSAAMLLFSVSMLLGRRSRS